MVDKANKSKLRRCPCGKDIAANMPSTINLCKNCGYNHYLIVFPDGSARVVGKSQTALRPESGDTIFVTEEQLRSLGAKAKD